MNNDRLRSITHETWSNLASKIISQAQLERYSNARLRKAMDILLPNNEPLDCKFIIIV